MSMEKSNIFKNTDNEDITLARSVIRRINGIKIPKVVDGFMSYSILSNILSNKYSLDEIANAILENCKAGYDLKIKQLSLSEDELEKAEKGTLLNFGVFTKEEFISNLKSTIEVLRPIRYKGYENWLSNNMNITCEDNIKNNIISEEEAKAIIIKTYKDVIDDILLLCNNSKYLKYLETPRDKLIYVFALGGIDFSLYGHVLDKGLYDEIKTNKNISRGFSILHFLLDSINEHTIEQKLSKLENELSDKTFLLNVKVPNVTEENDMTEISIDDIINLSKVKFRNFVLNK